jgi:hypothetical protein
MTNVTGLWEYNSQGINWHVCSYLQNVCRRLSDVFIPLFSHKKWGGGASPCLYFIQVSTFVRGKTSLWKSLVWGIKIFS